MQARCGRGTKGTKAVEADARGTRPGCRKARPDPRRAKTGGMPTSAGGGEAPDRRAEGVMSRPAGEALPQHPRPRPHRWCRRPGRWEWRARPRGPLTRPARSGPPRFPPAVNRSARAGRPREQNGRPVRLGSRPRAAPRPAPARPAPRAPPRPSPGPPRGRAGTARSPAALWAAGESGRTSRPARPAPNRRRLLLSPPPLPPAPPDREPSAPGPWLCPSRAGAARARPGAPPAPPWSSGPEAGGCCAWPSHWPPAPTGTLPARVGAAAKSATSTGPRASA